MTFLLIYDNGSNPADFSVVHGSFSLPIGSVKAAVVQQQASPAPNSLVDITLPTNANSIVPLSSSENILDNNTTSAILLTSSENILENNTNDTSQIRVPIFRRSMLVTEPHGHLQNYYCGNVAYSMPMSSSLYHITSYLHYDNCSINHKSFCFSISAQTDTSSFKQVVQFQCLRDSMEAELQALMKTKTWSLVSFPLGKRLMSSRWVYHIKYKADGSINRYKVRLVALKGSPPFFSFVYIMY
jgi:hypothetical protein